jgi:hypothetical protein
MSSYRFVRFSTFALTLCAAFFNWAATASAAAISTFDTDAENWSVVSFTNPNAGDFSVLGTTAPTYHATGGNPGGFISTLDPDNGDFMFGAPSLFLGNQSGAALLSYDLSYPVGNLDYKPVDIMLTNGATRLLWLSNPTPALGPGFTHIAVGLAPSANWHLGSNSGATPTAGDFQTVLANLSGLFISGEYTAGLIETPGLDNVQLSVPEPASMILAVVGLVALTIMARNRKR